MSALFDKFKPVALLLAVALVCFGCSSVPSTQLNPWTPTVLPTDATLLDIGFSGDGERGWIVGNRATILETHDGGTDWQERDLGLDPKLKLTSVSFAGSEGWIAGQPSLLLHTTDSGDTWERVRLSEKLPGVPVSVKALGPNSTEMATDIGAIYQTDDGGRTWQAQVQEAVGVARTIARSDDGRYVAVSARGNFYSTWEPGMEAWEPHERNSSRRVQAMGFGLDGRLWMLARGGQIQFTASDDPDSWEDPLYPELSTSWGLLDVAYRTPEEVWVAGGSGNLLASFDGGQTWQKDRAIENTPANLYRIVFLNPDRGFILGNDGVLLKYDSAVESVAEAG
ncbi:uncharacterized protein KR51_00028930 [Rubidibacter lacunae KORDI 51-2]|uniref:Photosystem II assembly protein Ycf48 n=1 Tax=Rubidibacter lacunae KORDI 51-2 TaxID=582515 RepID=U5DJ91_9CHRO|nr:photosynthesis system II assembly factor Ycf48 [Rubidibacter lacunae]ERN40634.1 uncharacterized protein KR51_00028930 [Rubidibacter lacunae KORDI 51-2]